MYMYNRSKHMHVHVIGNTAIRDWKTFYERSKMILRKNQQEPFKLSNKIKVGQLVVCVHIHLTDLPKKK